MPLLDSIYKKYGKLGFTMIGVNVEPDSKAANDWLKADSRDLSDPLRYRQQGE